MSNTYTQIFIHAVFSVKNRKNLIDDRIKESLYKYISGILSNQNQKLYFINGMPDHVHILLGMKADTNLSVLIKEIKASSSKYINESGLTDVIFHWQTGFGAFSVSKSQCDKVFHYIENQEKHHEHKSFEEEFIELLEAHGIEFNNKYLFD